MKAKVCARLSDSVLEILFLILSFVSGLLGLLLKSKDWKPGNFFFQTPIPAGFPFRFQE